MTARFMKNHPALKTGLLLSLGIASAKEFDISFHLLLLLTGFTIFLLILLSFLKRDWTLQLAVPIALLFIGGLRYVQLTRLFPDHHILRRIDPDATVTLEGFLIRDPVEKPGRLEMTFSAETLLQDTIHLRVTGKVRTTVYEPLPKDLHYGDGIRITGTLFRPRGRRNPGGFDYHAFLARQDIHVLLRPERGSHILKTGMRKGNRLLRGIVYPARRHIIRTIDENTVGDARAILRALLVGEKGTLEPDLRDQFAKAGIIHVLAVSGLHVGFVLLILTVLLGFLRFPYAWKTVLVILGLVFYALLTEAKPPVLRAGIMASVYLIGTLLERRTNPMNLVGVAALAILLWKPQELFDIGFQLSFSAILSILYFYEKMMRIPFIQAGYQKCIHYTLGRYLVPLLLVSLSAQLGTLPLTAVYFNRIPLLSVFVNLIAIPAVGIIVALGFVTILADLLHPWLTAVYGALNQEILTLLVKIISWIGDRPFAFLHVPSPDTLHILIYFILVLGLLEIHQKSSRKRYTFALLALVNLLVWRTVVRDEANQLTWIQLDVGQGDAAVLRLPRNRHVLIDGGDCTPYFDNGERVIAPYLRRKGIRRLDAVLITHPHNDHIGGLIHVLDHFQIGRVIAAGTPCESGMFQTLRQTIIRRRIPLTVITAPDTLTFPGVRLVFLSPSELRKANATDHNLNNQSLVCSLTFGSTRLMFTGDAEWEVEKEMLESNLPLASQVIKVGHHGSATSSSLPFLIAVHPETAVISVGERNRFHHPSASVLQRLESLGIEILRTDRQGACVFRSDGKTLERILWR